MVLRYNYYYRIRTKLNLTIKRITVSCLFKCLNLTIPIKVDLIKWTTRNGLVSQLTT